MATNHFVFGILCLAVTHFGGLLTSNTLKIDNLWHVHRQLISAPQPNQRLHPSSFVMRVSRLSAKVQDREAQGAKLLAIAGTQIGVREATGHNDGAQVEAYLKYTGNKKGEPWCASFVSWVFGSAGFKQPKTAWSPDLFPLGKQITLPVSGLVFGIYFPELKRIAHCGFVEKQQHSWLTTIEGNTNTGGSREGDGVYRKLRHIKTIKYYADWLVKEGRGKKP